MTAKKIFLVGVLVGATLMTPGCDLFGEDTGVCVSSPVSFSFGLRVYCQEDFNKNECTEYDDTQVNAADDWSFHSGQTCQDRGLIVGSNPWP